MKLRSPSGDGATMLVELLGPLQVQVDLDRRAVSLGGQKNAALLAYLSRRLDTAVPRETLRSVFWTDSGDAQAKASLRQCLSSLRRALGNKAAAALMAEGDQIRLGAPLAGTDIQDFERHSQSGQLDDLEAAAALVRGEFLDGFQPVTPEFDQWVEAERSMLRRAVSDVLDRLLGLYRDQANYEGVISVATRMLVLDPLQEHVHRDLIAAYLKQKKYSAGLKQFERLRGLLSDELDVAPEPETMALVREIRNARNNQSKDRQREPRIDKEPLVSFVSEVQTDGKPRLYVSHFTASGPDASDLADAIRQDISTAFARQSGIILVEDEAMAHYAVSGSLRGSGSRWRLSAGLTDRSDTRVVWSDRFSEDQQDVFELQDRLVTRLVGAVRIRMPGLMAEKLSGKPIADMTVGELLNHAMAHHFVPKRSSWDMAHTALERVLEEMPENWMAKTMLSFNTLARSRIFGLGRADSKDARRARTLIERALEDNLKSEVVRLVHGSVLLYADRNLSAAQLEAEAALQINPDYYHAINLRSQLWLFEGDLVRAEEAAERCAQCDVGHPYRHLYLRDKALVHAAKGAYETALACYYEANTLAPGLPQNLVGMAICAKLGGRDHEAEQYTQRLFSDVAGVNLDIVDMWPFDDQGICRRFRDALASSGVPGV